MKVIKTRKYILYTILALLLADQIANYIVEKTVWHDNNFFDEVLATADLTEISLNSSDENCAHHRIRLGYTANICFERVDWTHPERFDEGTKIIVMRYWPPRSHLASLFDDWWYYELVYTVESVMLVTPDKVILEDFRNR